MSQQCPTCRLYNPDTAIRCDCGYDFQTRETGSSYVVAEVARKHGGLKPLLESQGRRNSRAGGLLLGLGIVMVLTPLTVGGRPGLVPIGLMGSGVVLVVRGRDQKNAAARVANSNDPSAQRLVDRPR